MARTTKVLGFSVPAELAEEVERMARQEQTSKSELFRRMLAAYKAQRDEAELASLQSRMMRRARQHAGELTEEDVERMVFEDR